MVEWKWYNLCKNGDDKYYWGNEEEIVHGEKGDDDLLGGEDADELKGGSGAEYLFAMKMTNYR